MEVIYIDNHLLVANKPAGLSTQPHESDPDNFLDRAKKWIKFRYNKPGNVFLEPVHRLDKPVSGLVLFARTSKALSRLQASFRERAILKTYRALVEGNVLAQTGVLEHFLLHEEHRAAIVSSSHPQAKRASLSYIVLHSYPQRCLVEITLHTGRYHQIRAQFSAIGHPIVGDRKYKSRSAWKQEGAIALHHAKMLLKHPVSAQELIFEAEDSFGFTLG